MLPYRRSSSSSTRTMEEAGVFEIRWRRSSSASSAACANHSSCRVRSRSSLRDVVGRDLLDRNAGEAQQERADEPGAVLAAVAVDDDASVGRVRNRANRGGDVRPEVLQEDEVDLARGRGVVGGCRARLLHLLEDLRTVVEERHVHGLDRQLGGRILGELLVRAEVDDRPDAVVDDRLPARVGQLAHAVRPDDRPPTRFRAVLGRMPAEVAGVQQPVPVEVSATRQLLRAGCP